MIQPVNNLMPQTYSQGMPYMPQQMYQSTPYYQPQLPQNNAVKIDIINPQAGAQTPFNPYAMPTVPQYAMPTVPQYAMPQASTYASNVQYPAPVMLPVQQYTPVPVQTEAPASEAAPQAVIVPQPVVNNQPQIINAPQAEIPAPPQAQAATAIPAQATAEAPASATAQQKSVEAPQVETPASTPVNIDLNQVVSKLNSTNLDEQLSAIENIAETAQSNPTAATQLLDTQVMDALGNIIKKDTTQMQGPTPEQLELRQKILSDEQVTPEQKALANQISELETAERNKQFALYTVAILQKLLSTEVEKAQGTKLEMKDLPMINDVVKIAKADANPMLRASALAALSYIATPENKALLTTMFEQSKKDADPNVQAVAAEALSKLSQV